MTPEEALREANRLITLDHCAIRHLLEARTLINSDIKKAAEGFTYPRGEVTYLRPLGLINTILKSYGITISVKYDPDGNPVEFSLLQSLRK